MNLQPKRQTLITRKEFLNTTQGLIHKVGGITLDSAAFADATDADGYLYAGSAVSLQGSGLAIPASVNVEGAANGTVFVTANDVNLTDGDAVVGALEAAYLKSSVVTATEEGRVSMTQAIADATNGRFHLR